MRFSLILLITAGLYGQSVGSGIVQNSISGGTGCNPGAGTGLLEGNGANACTPTSLSTTAVSNAVTQAGTALQPPASGTDVILSGSAGGTVTTAATASAINHLSQNLSPITFIAAGDSQNYGSGSSGACNGGSTNSCSMAYLVANAKGWLINDIAVPGSIIADQLPLIFQQTISSSTYSDLIIGTNEASNFVPLGSAGWNQFYRSVMAAELWLSIVPATPSGNNQLIVGQSSGVTKTGTWTNVAEYGGAMGIVSTNQGDSISFSVPGNTAYVTQLIRDTTNSTIDIKISQNDPTHAVVDAGNFSLTKVYGGGVNNYSYTAESIRLSGLQGPAQHTVTVTCVTPGTTGCEFLFGAGSEGNFTSPGPYSYLLTQWYQNPAQNYQLTQVQVQTMQQIAQELSLDNLPVGLVNTGGYLNFQINPSLESSSPTLHPNNAGYAVLANAILSKMNNLVTPQDQIAAFTQTPEYNTVTVANGTGNQSVITPVSVSTNLVSAPLVQSHGSTATDSASLGSELTGSSGWTSTGWTGSYNAFTHTIGNTSALTSSFAPTIGLGYQVVITVSSRTAGSATLTFGGVAIAAFASNAAFTNGIPASTTGVLTITPTTDFDGTIAVSVKLITAIPTYTYGAFDSMGNVAFTIVPQLRSNVNTYLGYNVGLNNTTGAFNTAISPGALQSITTGTRNVCIGNSACNKVSYQIGNTALGSAALGLSTTSGNTAIGDLAQQLSTTGASNTCMGFTCMSANTTGSNNTAVGYQSLVSTQTGGGNTAVGAQSLLATTSGSNTAVGYRAAFSLTTPANIVAVGYQALLNDITSSTDTAVGYESQMAETNSNNTSLGYETLLVSTSGNNTAVGASSLIANTTGGTNSAIGAGSLQGLTSGQSNTAVGYQSGYGPSGTNALTTGSTDSFFGYNAAPASTTQHSHMTVLGADATCDADNIVCVGRSGLDSVRVSSLIGSGSATITVNTSGAGSGGTTVCTIGYGCSNISGTVTVVTAGTPTTGRIFTVGLAPVLIGNFANCQAFDLDGTITGKLYMETNSLSVLAVDIAAVALTTASTYHITYSCSQGN